VYVELLINVDKMQRNSIIQCISFFRTPTHDFMKELLNYLLCMLQKTWTWEAILWSSWRHSWILLCNCREKPRIRRYCNRHQPDSATNRIRWSEYSCNFTVSWWKGAITSITRLRRSCCW